MTGRGLTSGGKSSSGYSTQLIRPGSSGNSARTGDQTGATAAAAGESLRGWRRGRQQGPQETKRAAIWDAHQITNEWLNMLSFFLFPSHRVLTYGISGGMKQKRHGVLSLSQHGAS